MLDRRFFFSWYGGDFTTDPALAGDDVTPEQRANPSMASWGNDGYLEQQRARLPAAQYRRLHLNLPGAPEGAAFDGDAVLAAVVSGRKRVPYDPNFNYVAGVDMSGGSHDAACCAVLHHDAERDRLVLDALIDQGVRPPFDPRMAITKFCALLAEYKIAAVHGDGYGGNTFRADFQARRVAYHALQGSKHVLYEALEAPLLSGEIELLDDPVLTEELLCLVYRGSKIDHPSNGADDHANAVAAAVYVALERARQPEVPWVTCYVATNSNMGRGDRVLETSSAAGGSFDPPPGWSHGSW